MARARATGGQEVGREGSQLGMCTQGRRELWSLNSHWEYRDVRRGAENQPLWPRWPQHRGVPGLTVRGSGWDRAFGPSETHSTLLPCILLVSDLLGEAGHTLPTWALLDHVLLSSW